MPKPVDSKKLDRVVAAAQRRAIERMGEYREQSLRLFPWVCARCGREFTRKNLHELTVHHKDHDHDNNPSDGSNWENLCLYCHDWEHQKYTEHIRGTAADFRVTHAAPKTATHRPLSDLKQLLQKKK